uniref:Uncharacterized protein n=1 Tax=Brassica campestris TaxID=3711 RepID=A0A3P6ALA0_BRACM|nr:unnamed protein product [Brassica rapa]
MVRIYCIGQPNMVTLEQMGNGYPFIWFWLIAIHLKRTRRF